MQPEIIAKNELIKETFSSMAVLERVFFIYKYKDFNMRIEIELSNTNPDVEQSFVNELADLCMKFGLKLESYDKFDILQMELDSTIEVQN